MKAKGNKKIFREDRLKGGAAAISVAGSPLVATDPVGLRLHAAILVGAIYVIWFRRFRRVIKPILHESSLGCKDSEERRE